MIALPPWLKRKDPAQARLERLAKLLESPIETLYWTHGYKYLSRYGCFEPQTEIGPYRADFTLTRIPGVKLLKVVIELDGHEHHKSQEQRNYDEARKQDFQLDGWRVIVFTGSKVYGDCNWCINRTVQLVRLWSWQLR